MFRRALSCVAALLAAFHVWIFLSQAWTGALVDPALIARWLIAGGLVFALANLRRRGLPLLTGRHAIAVWLIAGLLHGPAISRGADNVAAPLPEVVATIAQALTSLTAAGTLLLLLVAQRAPLASRRLAILSLDAPHLVGALPHSSFLSFAPRPPPALD